MTALAVGAAGWAGAAAAQAPRVDAAIGQEARIAFPSRATIHTFRAVNDGIVYIQDQRRRWYRASVIGPCIDLPWVQAIGVDTRGSGTLDRFSTLLVGRDRCQLNSFVRVDGPPAGERR